MAAQLVVPYSEEHARAHAEFARRNWPDNELRRDPHYNRWKFRCTNGDIEGLLLAVRSGKVMGQVGVTPVTLRSAGVNYAAQWASDFRVDPAFRIQGIGPLLIARTLRPDLPTLADAPTLQSRPVLKGLGFQQLKGPQRMRLPLAPIRVASRVLSRTILRKHQRLVPAAVSLTRLYLAWRARRLRPGAHPGAVTKCHWEELTDLIQEAQRKIGSPHVIHDASFLKWRCMRLGEAWSGMHGLRTSTGGYVLFGRHRENMFVFDWRASDWEESRTLFFHCCEAGRQIGADNLSVLTNTAQEQEWLRKLGFFITEKPYEVYCHSACDLPLPTGCFHLCHLDAHANL